MRDAWKIRTRAGLMAAAALTVTGCTSVPVLWPLSEPAPLPPGYPSAIPRIYGTDSPPVVCTDKGVVDVSKTTMPAPDAKTQQTQSLYCAQAFAVNVAQKFAREQRAVEATQNGQNVALFGLGTAAGVEGVVTKAATPIRNLGLAAAGVAGIGSSLGFTGQRTIYAAGASAMACLIAVDAALDSAAPMAAATAAGATGQLNADATASGAGTDMMAPLTLGKDANARVHGARITMMTSMLQGAPGKVRSDRSNGATTDKDKAIADESAAGMAVAGATAMADAMQTIAQAHNAAMNLQSVTAAQTDPTTRARNLQTATAAINKAVAEQLFKSVDVTKLYDAAKAGYASIGGSMAAGQKTTQSAINNVNPTGLSLLQNIGASVTDQQMMGMAANMPAKMSASMNEAMAAKTMTTAMMSAEQTSMMAKKTADTYDSCVAEATTTPQTQPPAQQMAGK